MKIFTIIIIFLTFQWLPQSILPTEIFNPDNDYQQILNADNIGIEGNFIAIPLNIISPSNSSNINMLQLDNNTLLFYEELSKDIQFNQDSLLRNVFLKFSLYNLRENKTKAERIVMQITDDAYHKIQLCNNQIVICYSDGYKTMDKSLQNISEFTPLPDILMFNNKENRLRFDYSFDDDMQKIVWSSSIDGVCIYDLSTKQNQQLLAPYNPIFYSEVLGGFELLPSDALFMPTGNNIGFYLPALWGDSLGDFVILNLETGELWTVEYGDSHNYVSCQPIREQNKEYSIVCLDYENGYTYALADWRNKTVSKWLKLPNAPPYFKQNSVIYNNNYLAFLQEDTLELLLTNLATSEQRRILKITEPNLNFQIIGIIEDNRIIFVCQEDYWENDKRPLQYLLGITPNNH